MGPFYALAMVLGAAGVLKAYRPASAARALSDVGLAVPPGVVRAGALAEVLVAIGALALGNRLFALLVAASYLLFAVFVGMALARDVPVSSCGCFGAGDTPPTALHLAVNTAGALIAGLVALDPAGAPTARGVMGDGLLSPAVFLASTVATAALMYLALTSLPRLYAATADSRRRTV